MNRFSLLVLLLTIVPCRALSAENLTGQASVIDGDTIEIHGTRARLFGIDAPESSQTCQDATGRPWRCGQRAANGLADLLGRKTVICIPRNTDQYGRLVAICSVDGQDIGEWLVHNGLAVDYAYYSKGRYRAAQDAASRAHVGIWAGAFVEPRRYRDCLKGTGVSATCSEPIEGAQLSTVHPARP